MPQFSHIFVIKKISSRPRRTHSTTTRVIFFLVMTHLYSSRECYSEAFIFRLTKISRGSNRNFGHLHSHLLQQDWDFADTNYLVSRPRFILILTMSKKEKNEVAN